MNIEIPKEKRDKKLLEDFLKCLSIEDKFERLRQLIFICGMNDVKIVYYIDEYEYKQIDEVETISNFARFLRDKNE